MRTLFKNDRAGDAGYFITSAMRQASGRLKTHRESWRADTATYGRRYFGFLPLLVAPNSSSPRPTRGILA